MTFPAVVPSRYAAFAGWSLPLRDVGVFAVAIVIGCWRLIDALGPINASSRGWCASLIAHAPVLTLSHCAADVLTSGGIAALVGLAVVGVMAVAGIALFIGAGSSGAAVAAVLWIVMSREPSLAENGALDVLIAGQLFLIGLAMLVWSVAHGRAAFLALPVGAGMTTMALHVIAPLSVPVWIGTLIVCCYSALWLQPRPGKVEWFLRLVLPLGVILWGSVALMGTLPRPHFHMAQDQAPTVPALLRAIVAACRRVGVLIWQIAGPFLALALVVYAATCWRLARIAHTPAALLFVLTPLALLVAEGLVGASQWYNCHVALVPFVILPARVWRGF